MLEVSWFLLFPVFIPSPPVKSQQGEMDHVRGLEPQREVESGLARR